MLFQHKNLSFGGSSPYKEGGKRLVGPRSLDVQAAGFSSLAAVNGAWHLRSALVPALARKARECLFFRQFRARNDCNRREGEGMASRLFCSLVVIASALMLVDCPNTTYSISGTFSGNSWAFVNPLTVTATSGSNVYSATANFSNPGVSSVPQSVSFSIGGLPPGTYTVRFNVNSSATWAFKTGFPDYTINGGTQAAANGSADPSSPYDETAQIGNVAIAGSETIDVDFGLST
jgi:hypothetical protein